MSSPGFCSGPCVPALTLLRPHCPRAGLLRGQEESLAQFMTNNKPSRSHIGPAVIALEAEWGKGRCSSTGDLRAEQGGRRSVVDAKCPRPAQSRFLLFIAFTPEAELIIAGISRGGAITPSRKCCFIKCGRCIKFYSCGGSRQSAALETSDHSKTGHYVEHGLNDLRLVTRISLHT